MLSNGNPARAPLAVADPQDAALPPLSRRQKFRLVVKVVELRLRFIALMAVTGLVFAYWDTLWNRYDKWMRPGASSARAARPASSFTARCTRRSCSTSRARCPICGMPLAKRKKGEKATLARRGHGPRRARAVPGGAGRHQDRRGGLRPADPDPDDRRVRRVRRAADGQHRLQGPRQVAGREAVRQLHRSGRRGRPDPGRALQPRAVPGDPGAA